MGFQRTFFHETIYMNNKGLLRGQLKSSPYRIHLRETHQKASAGCIMGSQVFIMYYLVRGFIRDTAGQTL